MREITTLLALLLAACAAEVPTCESGDCTGLGGKGDGADGRGVEVLLTEPFCDICTSADKDLLLERSPVMRRVIELIDGAEASVSVAQYTFSRRPIEEALVRAHERGVAVRIAIDAGQDRDGSLARRLVDAGLEVRFVRGRPVGERFGLLHTKFLIVDGTSLATGSNNWSSTGVSINEENTIVVQAESGDPVIAGFACHFERIWESDLDGAGSCSNGPVAFTPSSAGRNLVRDGLREAEATIDVLMHHLVFDDLREELVRAAERGVHVRVIVNEADRDEHTRGSDWQRFFAAGGEMRFKRGNAGAYQLMHHKLAIVDGRVLLNGSGNWSGSAFYNNYENFVRWEDPAVVRRFDGLFARLWRWSLDAGSLDAGISAAEQDANATRVYFGNLHAHFAAGEIPELLDDGERHVLDEAGEPLEIDAGDTIPEAAQHAFEYARDVGGLDFLALTPHCSDERETDGADHPRMSEQGFEQLGETAREVTRGSDGGFLALAGMEWSTNSTGNHINVLGSSEIAHVERGAFDALYGEFLPRREAFGDRPVVMLNHPRTFRRHQDTLSGSWDQVFGVPLTDITNNSQRTKKFNDYGIDDFPPLSDVRASWLDGSALPDPAIVDQTLVNLWGASRDWVRLMEVTVGRGKELGSETAVNPSISIDAVTGELSRYTKVHTDYDYYLTRGFRIAPAASHDNHLANWGAGHTSRTAIFAESLSEESLLAAIRDRAVYASEDENLALRFYVEGRVRMGEATATTAASVTAQVHLADPDYAGPYEVRVWVGRVGGEVAQVSTIEAEAGWTNIELPLESGEQFVYLEIVETDANRMAWTAPIWIERLTVR